MSLLLPTWRASAEEAARELRAAAAYVRTPPPGQHTAAAFFVLENTAKQAHRLVEVSCGCATRAELHTHTRVDGMMQMRAIHEVTIPAGGRVRFAPGGLHVMLFGLELPRDEARHVTLTLTFEDGSRTQVQAQLRSVLSES